MAGFVALGPWAWLIAGLVLVGLETIAPGVFLVWLGIAAILTGVADWAFGLPWQTNLFVFAILALLAVAAGRAMTRRRGEAASANPHLNRRTDALVGRVFRLDGPLVSGQGRIRVDDTVWRVTGPEMAGGARVRVLRAEGTTLVVEGAGPA